MRKKRSKILDAVHATARGLHAADAIGQVTIREFDQVCLQPVPPLHPAEIKRIRESANVNQAVVAARKRGSNSGAKPLATNTRGRRGSAGNSVK